MILLFSLFNVLFIDGLWHFEGCREACVGSLRETFRALGSNLEFNSTGPWYLFLFCLFVCLFPPIKYNLNETEAHDQTKNKSSSSYHDYYCYWPPKPDILLHFNISEILSRCLIRDQYLLKSIFPSFMLTSLETFWHLNALKLAHLSRECLTLYLYMYNK